MPDISMCSGKGCPLRVGCYRHRAHPCEWRQSWLMVPPYDKAKDECDMYWPVGDRTRLRPIPVEPE